MTLIILAIFAAFLVALNCFYNLSALVCYVWHGSDDRFIKDVESKLSIRRYEEENYVFNDSDFDM